MDVSVPRWRYGDADRIHLDREFGGQSGGGAWVAIAYSSTKAHSAQDSRAAGRAQAPSRSQRSGRRGARSVAGVPRQPTQGVALCDPVVLAGKREALAEQFSTGNGEGRARHDVVADPLADHPPARTTGI